jgi:hypothetical protein
MTTYLQIARERCPKAAARGRIHGQGSFALLSCNDGASRHVRLFESASDRARTLSKWESGPNARCGVYPCNSDHVLIDLEISGGQSNSSQLTMAKR